MKITVIIPTLNPSEKILNIISQLCNMGFHQIIIVNDGSDREKQWIFEQIALIPQCKLIVHPHNYGKGKALKTALEYYLKHNVESRGIITCDDDGQHCIEDIVNCAKLILSKDRSLILGVRHFKRGGVPFKSQVGNLFTRWYMEKICHMTISDTQTGLRGIPNAIIPTILHIPGNRFEYEINMLLETKKCGIPIQEVPISTVYIEDNRATRFHPIKDSLQIYLQLAKFSLSSVVSFLVDIITFMLICKMLNQYAIVGVVFLATLISRFSSSIVNYLTNKQLVFCYEGTMHGTAIRYYTLCVLQALLSFSLVAVLTHIFSAAYVLPLKILVDGCLFLLSFNIQKYWVFQK